jgi:hypothetical protein
MRRYGIFLGASAVALLFFVVGLDAQFGGGGKGGFGFFGKGLDPIVPTLLQRNDVKKELDLTEEQSEKIRGAVMKAVATVLTGKQAKRFREIDLQVRGNEAFTDPQLKKDLKITDAQVKSIQQILEDSTKEQKEIFADAKGGNFAGFQEKMQGLQKETKEKVMGVLTADQRKAYKQMLGDEFKQDLPKFGGFKKKDN